MLPPPKLSKKQFKALQRRWYARAKKPYKDQDGNRQQFRDIECGWDLNKFNAMTFRGPNPNGRNQGSYILMDFQRSEHDSDDYARGSSGWDGTSGIAESDTYERFQRIGEYVHSLPDDDTAKRVLLAVLDCDANVTKAAHKLRLPRSLVKDVWDDALGRLSLTLTRHTPPADPPPEPGPVRVLSKSEIKRLAYQQPKKGKV